MSSESDTDRLKVLVVAPHPDDEVIGCGGTISRLGREGHDVDVLIVNSQSKIRFEESKDSGRILGVSNITSLYQDATGLQVPTRQLVNDIEVHIDLIRPDVVLLPSEQSAHQEHHLVSKSAIAALRPSSGSGRHRPGFVLCYEEVADSWPPTPSMAPTFFVTITQFDLDRKISALRAHRTQLREMPSERSEQSLRSLATIRGSLSGQPLAEGFAPILISF